LSKAYQLLESSVCCGRQVKCVIATLLYAKLAREENNLNVKYIYANLATDQNR